jgi:hypothetical protein
MEIPGGCFFAGCYICFFYWRVAHIGMKCYSDVIGQIMIVGSSHWMLATKPCKSCLDLCCSNAVLRVCVCFVSISWLCHVLIWMQNSRRDAPAFIYYICCQMVWTLHVLHFFISSTYVPPLQRDSTGWSLILLTYPYLCWVAGICYLLCVQPNDLRYSRTGISFTHNP